jgi:hypothetical protein
VGPQAGYLGVALLELILSDRAAPAKVGGAIRVNDGIALPAQLDAAIAFLRDTPVPTARRLSGYQSSRAWLNRETGRPVVSTSWATAADREASEAVMGQIRQQSSDIAQLQRPPRVSLYEVLLLDQTPALEQATATEARTG